ncbi:MAG TPA: hypothetical protein VN653_12320 [Anaerolineales bacterium]|nr:hypothetical protein [Anaerolineales bacterium]
MKTREHERRDYVIVLVLILLVGFLCIVLASGWALRFDPSWKLPANMNSNLNPDSDFLTSRPVSFFEPLDPSILTNPAWLDVFLTPGASFSTRTPMPTATSTSLPPNTSTLIPTQTASQTLIFINTNTPIPAPTRTKIPNTSGPPATFTSTGPPVATMTYTPTATATLTFTPTPTATSALISVDLQVTKDDGTPAYTSGSQTTYTVTIANNGLNGIIGAVLVDIKPLQITSWDWVCVSQTGGAANCNGVLGSSADFNDVVDLPVGASITYSVTASVSANAAGALTNTASANVPAGYVDANLANNSATDSDAPSMVEPDIGGPDGSWITLPPGSSTTILFSPAIIADGDIGTPDMVYYEKLAAPTHIDLDWVQVEISSDGLTWYQVFFWGDGPSDDNTNVSLSIPPPTGVGDLCQVAGVPTETDNCSILVGRLYNSTGITIDVDALVPSGNYPWIRISSPPGSSNGADVDAIQPYYP